MNASGTFSLKINNDSKASMALYKVDNGKKEPSGWQSLSEELLLQCVTALVKLAEQDKSQKDSFLVVRSYAALLCVSRYWRKVAFKVPLSVFCRPTPRMLGWLRKVPVRVLKFPLVWVTSSANREWQNSELCHRASISTLLAHSDFQKISSSHLQVLGPVHPRPGILNLSPFRELRRLKLMGRSSDICNFDALSDLKQLRFVKACGYGSYNLNGLPSSVKSICLRWSHPPGTLQLQHLPLKVNIPDCLTNLSLEVENQDVTIPIVISNALDKCDSINVTTSHCYLALPVQRASVSMSEGAVCDTLRHLLITSTLNTLELLVDECLVIVPRMDNFVLHDSTGETIAGAVHLSMVIESLAADPQNRFSTAISLQPEGWKAIIKKKEQELTPPGSPVEVIRSPGTI